MLDNIWNVVLFESFVCVYENPGAKTCKPNVCMFAFVSVFDLVIGVSRTATAHYILIYVTTASALSIENRCNAKQRSGGMQTYP